ncbi:hypothetical protein ACFLX1_02310 [Chloroflexota bacterium]
MRRSADALLTAGQVADTGRLGCDDYTEELGIVKRIGQIGYATSLTLNEMKNEIGTIAYFFSAEQG